jgi:hypothetical protein
MKSSRRAPYVKATKSAARSEGKRISPLPRWIAPPVVVASLITAFGACGNGGSRGFVEYEAIAECDAYAEAYRACTGRLGARAAVSGERHLSTMHGEVAEAASDPEERERLRASCVAQTAMLARACR